MKAQNHKTLGAKFKKIDQTAKTKAMRLQSKAQKIQDKVGQLQLKIHKLQQEEATMYKRAQEEKVKLLPLLSAACAQANIPVTQYLM